MKNKIIFGSMIFMVLLLWNGMTEKVYADTQTVTEQESTTIEESITIEENTTIEESGEMWEDEETTTKLPEVTNEANGAQTSNPGAGSETTIFETTNVPAGQPTTTKKNPATEETATTKRENSTKPVGSENDTEAIKSDVATGEKSVVTIIDFSKKSKKKKTAQISVYTLGKQKTTKTKITVKINRKVKGKWKKYKAIKKSQNSFYLYLKKTISLKKKGKYRAVVTVYYYNEKKQIGKYKKASKKMKM